MLILILYYIYTEDLSSGKDGAGVTAVIRPEVNRAWVECAGHSLDSILTL